MTIATAPPTQEQQMLAALQAAGSAGVHTHQIRRHLFIANPSERRRRLQADGWEIDSVPERSPFGGRSWGSRYRLLAVPGGAVVTTEPVTAGRQLVLQPGTAPEADQYRRAA